MYVAGKWMAASIELVQSILDANTAEQPDTDCVQIEFTAVQLLAYARMPRRYN